MIVYRVCRKEEVITLLNSKSTTNLGSKFITNKMLNTFEYKPNKKYLHFFTNFEDIFYLDSQDKNYICTYDIPDEILTICKGTGYYLDRINYRRMEFVEEYAIEIELLNYDFLKQIARIESPIILEDYLDGDYQITPIYNSDDKPLQKKLSANKVFLFDNKI